MKKLLSLLVSLSLVIVCFSGCAKEGTGETTGTEPIKHSLKVGFGRVDISPTESVPMSGYGNEEERFSTEVTEKLYATCVAFTDEADNTILLYHLDLIQSYTQIIPMHKLKIAKETGIPATNIMVACTHTHAAPACLSSRYPVIEDYVNSLKTWMVDAAKQAMADRKPAQMFTASTKAENLNFIRHYIMNDGSIVGDNFGTASGKQYVKHTSEPDNTLQLVKFTREGGNDVIIANWQAHPHRATGKTKTAVTSDIVGVMREKMEKELGCSFAYFAGASGNVNSHSRIKSENITKDYIEQGQVLAQHAIDASPNYKPAQIGKVQIIGQTYTAKQNPTKGNGTVDLPLNAFSLGDVGFVTIPGEFFSERGLDIKEKSPFAMTFVVTLANSHYYYIPAAEAFEYDSYEAGVSRVEKGTAEKLVETYISMLNQLYQTRT